MSSTRKAWVVAASVGAVEAMKDQLGFCRWNYTLRSLHQHAKQSLRSSSSQSNKSSSQYSTAKAAIVGGGMSKFREEKIKKSEESLRTVMYLSSWAPN